MARKRKLSLKRIFGGKPRKIKVVKVVRVRGPKKLTRAEIVEILRRRREATKTRIALARRR